MKYRTKYFYRDTRDSFSRRRSGFYANDASRKKKEGAESDEEWKFYTIDYLGRIETDEYGEIKDNVLFYLMRYLDSVSRKSEKAPCKAPKLSVSKDSIVVKIKKDAEDFIYKLGNFCAQQGLCFYDIPASWVSRVLYTKKPEPITDSVKGSAPITYDQLQDFYDNKCRNPKEKRIVKDFIDDAYSDGYYDGKDETGWTWADLYESLGRRAIDDSVRSKQKNKRW